jgi:heat shock protein HslJ
MTFRLLPVVLLLVASLVASPTRAMATPMGASISITELPHYHWRLQEAVDGRGKHLHGLIDQKHAPLQLDFTADRVNVSNACNGMGGSYHVVEERLAVGPMMHTMMACPDPVLMQRERSISSLLQGRPTLILAGSREVPLLTLTADDGHTLTFEGVPTAATRYGSAGETVFLEVAPNSVPCHHPLMRDTQCLRVRELHYDAQGLRTGTPGPWQALAQNIEGFSHRPGERNVIRVKRYALKNVPVDAPSVAYELDMVVESGPATSRR